MIGMSYFVCGGFVSMSVVLSRRAVLVRWVCGREMVTQRFAAIVLGGGGFCV